jgi:acyl transferase domain-containing protein/NADPH:quinone reductase-like Zn-dependent oxidoreductase/acyl carrier protein
MTNNNPKELSPLKQAFLAIEKLEGKIEALENEKRAPIAIIGMGCRFPGGANTPEAYWQLLRNGVDAVRELDRWDMDAYYDPDADAPGKMSTRWAGLIDQVDQFDPQFFGIAPREAISMDPQQRLLLEVAWEALEYAGQAPDKLYGSKTGVFIGLNTDDYVQVEMEAGGIDQIDAYYVSGFAHSIASGRISYILGLHGPSITLDTACSSSLVATHLAVQSLRSGESDLAMAGGVNLILAPDISIALSKYHMMAPDGRCKAFDASADGFVRGEGCGIVVLKRLDDALRDGDNILAVIRGTAVNQDGPSSGLTAPNGPSQENVIREALANAGAQPSDIGFVETHGTGTSLGDPIEVQAIGAVLGKRRPGEPPLLIGSAKANVGHLEAAAGVAGLIKAILVIQHGEVPAQLHVNELNPLIPWDNYSITVPTERADWTPTSGKRLAGVSSFGFSGTNAHIVLEEAPNVGDSVGAQRAAPLQRPSHILTLSGQGEDALRELAQNYERYFAENPDTALADVAYTANTGRSHFSHRLGVIASTDVREKLAAFASGERAPGIIAGQIMSADPPRIAFLFTGQGAQYIGMGRQLYDTQPTFRAALDQCDEYLGPYLKQPLLSVLYPDMDADGRAHSHAPLQEGLLDDTTYTQPALFALEYALAQLWMSWGIQPNIVMGHSVGEYVAAVVAGLFSLEDGIKLIAERGRLMGALPAGGQMAAVFADEETVKNAIAPFAREVSIGAINGPDNIVISGVGEAVQQVIANLKAQNIKSRPLNVSHAFHSPLMEPMLKEFERVASSVTFNPPKIKLISNVTGQAAGKEVMTPAYWRRHVREGVRFADGMMTLHEQGYGIFVEIGPSPTLIGMGQRCIPENEQTWLPSLKKGRDEWGEMLASLSELYVYGASIDWSGFDRDYSRTKLVLPTYPFQRERYWVKKTARKAAKSASGVHPLLGRRLRSPLKDVRFEAEFSADSFSFLNDHRIFGMAVLPATAYIEMALAAAREVFSTGAIEDLEIQEALVVADDSSRAVQMILTPQGRDEYSFQLFSAAESTDDWKTHAAGTIVKEPHPQPLPINGEGSNILRDVQSRCKTTISAESHYAGLREKGLYFGPSLFGVREIWRADGEALARIELPDSLRREASAYGIHPALLDACLQAVAAALPGDSDLYMPLSIDRVQVFGNVGTTLWSHAVVDPRTSSKETYSASIEVMSDAGEIVAEITGLRLKRATRDALMRIARTQVDWHDWLYQVEWQPAPPSGLGSAAEIPTPLEIADYTSATATALTKNSGLVLYGQLRPKLDLLSAGYIWYALQQLGWQPRAGERVTTDELANHLGVIDSYRRLLGRILGMLEEDGVLKRADSGWQIQRTLEVIGAGTLHARWEMLMSQYSMYEAELVLTQRCGSQLAEVLRGTADPLQILFPAGELSLTEKLYTQSPVAIAYNGLVQAALAGIATRVHEGHKLRILEIGAGTGGTTGFALKNLPADQTEYIFTDISPLFTAKAAQRFEAYPFMSYQTLNIEYHPERQGFEQGQVDLILAANVIHATADLKQTLEHIQWLLAPGGTLLMLEMIRHERWVDLTFGLTDGWWRFVDDRDYPLITQESWIKLLTETGFIEAAAVPESGQYEQAIIAARAPQIAKNWLIFADQGGIAEGLADLIRMEGGHCTLVWPGANYAAFDEGTLFIDLSRPEHFWHIVNNAPEPFTDVVHLWSLDLPSAEDLSDNGLENAQEWATGSALNLTQALVEHGGYAPRLWLVTRGAMPLGGESLAVQQAPIWGLGKVIALEHPELRCKRIDLDPNGGDIHTILDAICTHDDEDQIALRRDTRYVARLTRYEAQNADVVGAGLRPAPTEDVPMRLDITERGVLDNLTLKPIERRAPGRGEVEIRVYATGLNFKDALNAMGMYPGDAGLFGGECAGEIVAVGEGVVDLQIGDAVMAVAGGSFSTHVTVSAQLVVRKPDFLGFEDAATIPIPFLTAYFTLNHLAGMQAGDKVLIHAAAGGVGLAAVQLARQAGAEIFGTAGSDEKRAYLESLGVHHVMNSRTLNFVDEIQAITNGMGVNIVLNSLADEFVPASFSVLGKGGRFLEIGKRGILSHREAKTRRPDAAYFIIDWTNQIREEPSLIRSMLLNIVDGIENGTLQPLPKQVFPISDVIDAFRYMAQAKHIGKIVVRQSPHPQPHPLQGVGRRGEVIHADATYLITGGLGGLGLLLSRWLVEKGARNLVLMGRSSPNENAQKIIRELEKSGAQVVVARADVSRESDVMGVLMDIQRTMPPLQGVIHAAGALDDGTLIQQNWSRFETVMKAKIQGAWHLHHLTRHMHLDFFALFSSIASLFGSRGQSNHAAANTFMDILAHHRIAQGLPALSINWGAWAEVGAAVDYGVSERAFAKGISLMNPDDALRTFENLLIGSPPQIGVTPVDWPTFMQQFDSPPPFYAEVAREQSHKPVVHADAQAAVVTTTAQPDILRRIGEAGPGKKRAILAAYIGEQAAKVLGLESARRMDENTPLSALGLDSLMAVELRNLLGAGLGLKRALPATLVFDYPTIQAITDYLARESLGLTDESVGAQRAAPEAPASETTLDMVDNLSELSDEEVDRLFEEQLKRMQQNGDE